jgi:hypothetical protein
VTSEESKSSPWDVFIHLLAVIALYAAMWSALSLLFSFVDLGLPDPADRPIDIRDSIRIALAVLIIFFPAYVWAWRSIEVDLAANREKRRRWLRTCPIYLTLFVAGVFALGDLSYVVYYFLTGDLTSRVILKVASIALVAGAVFIFYLHALRREPGPYARGARSFAYAASAILVVVAIAGFAVAGSPKRARLQHLDAKRLQDLDSIQDEVVSYFKSKRELPTSTAELDDDLRGFTVPSDPEPYQYRKTGEFSFELCADFALQDDDARHSVARWNWQAANPRDVIWNHPAGHVCFSRKVDPSRYPPVSERELLKYATRPEPWGHETFIITRWRRVESVDDPMENG